MDAQLTSVSMLAYGETKTLLLRFGEQQFELVLSRGDCVEKVKTLISGLLIDIEAVQRNRTNNE